MKVAYLFPGQGAQQPGMLHTLPGHPAVPATLAAARSPDDGGALRSTVTAQVDLYLEAVAWASALAAEGARPDAVAGHSVGTFAAAVAAGVLTFEEGLSAVRLRATSMQNDFGSGYGMVAILGLTSAAVRKMLAVATTQADPLYIALINARDQIVVTGSEAALDRVPAAAKAAGARDAQRLDVNVLSHCPPLAPVASALSKQLAAVPLRTPRVPYWCDSTGRLTSDGTEVLDDLSTNVATTVQWARAVPILSELGTELFVQLPPGDTLARLAAHDTSQTASSRSTASRWTTPSIGSAARAIESSRATDKAVTTPAVWQDQAGVSPGRMMAVS